MRQAFQCRIAARPADAVQIHIAEPACRDKAILTERWQENAIMVRREADRGKGIGNSLPELGSGVRVRRQLEENELTIFDLSRNTREHLIVLGQVLEKRLTAPVSRRGRSQPKFRSPERNRKDIERLVVDAQIRQTNQLFGVMFLSIERLHQIAAEI